MRRIVTTLLLAICAVQIAAGDRAASAADLDLLPSILVSPANTKVRLSSVANISYPGDMAPVPDGSGRLLVTDLLGTISMINGTTVQTYHTMNGPNTFPPFTSDTAFTSIAFHPGFANPASPGYKKFYSLEPENPGTAAATFSPQFSSTGTTYHHQNVLYEYTVADPAANTIGSFTKRQIMRANQPMHNHNTDDLAFDANGLLYISVGDGGNNPTNRQNAPLLTTIYGKVLRIDPLGLQGSPSSNGQYSTPTTNPFAAQGGGVRKEIFTYGNRNPYRISIDSVTGNLYIGEVGQDNVEEVNVVPNVNAAVSGGQNFGWSSKEGSIIFSTLTADPDTNGNGNGDYADTHGFTDPILNYDHQDGSDIIGGFVYRGALFPELYGKYVFGDNRGPRSNGAEYPVPNDLGRFFYGDLTTHNIYQFNVSLLGNTLPTQIYSIGQNNLGELYVLGLNGVFAVVPELPGDFNHDNIVDGADYVMWRKTSTNVASYNVWRSNFGSSLGAGSGSETDSNLSTSVPEPSLAAFLLTLALVIGNRRHRYVV